MTNAKDGGMNRVYAAESGGRDGGAGSGIGFCAEAFGSAEIHRANEPAGRTAIAGADAAHASGESSADIAARRAGRIRVLLADDHPHGREGMREILDGDEAFDIVGEAVNGEQAVLLAAELGPDLVLMDINMPVMNGMEATQHIKAVDPRIKIVMVTVSDEITDLFEAIKRGAQGYLLKNLSPSSWLEYLRAVAIEEAPLSRELAFRLLQEFSGGTVAKESGIGGSGTWPKATGFQGADRSWPKEAANQGADRLSGSAPYTSEADSNGREHAARSLSGEGKSPLTQREREVLERVAAGSSNRQIGEAFGISENTVKNHLKNILQKLHLDNRVQLTRYAMEKGLLGKGRFTD